MKGRDAMDPQDGMANPGTTSTSGAIARQDDRARGAAKHLVWTTRRVVIATERSRT